MADWGLSLRQLTGGRSPERQHTFTQVHNLNLVLRTQWMTMKITQQIGDGQASARNLRSKCHREAAITNT